MDTSDHIISKEHYQESAFTLKPFQPVSLLDMMDIGLQTLNSVFTWLSGAHMASFCQSDEYPKARLSDPEGELLDRKQVVTFLDSIRIISSVFGLKGSESLADEILEEIDEITLTNLSHSLGQLRGILRKELLDKRVLYIPQEAVKWFKNEKTFGENALSAFPSAMEDIKEAGNCFALDRPTACVFHCMRILEYGLCALANNVGVTFDKQQWHTIIEKIEHEIKELRKGPQGNEKNDHLQFLCEAAKEFMYFKDGWRNHVTHRRMIYDLSQAASILGHTRLFMSHLATRLHE